jgi:hypothetical protein
MRCTRFPGLPSISTRTISTDPLRSGHLVISYPHLFSANLLGDLRGMARTRTAGPSSTALSTPIIAQQDRGFLADLENLTNRLNVITFAGGFSGTALAPPRRVAARLQVEF